MVNRPPDTATYPAWVDPLWVSAAKRAVRTFIQTFFGVIFAAWIGLGDTNVSGLGSAFQTHWDEAAGAALLAALAAIGWRIADHSAVPTLNDAATRR